MSKEMSIDNLKDFVDFILNNFDKEIKIDVLYYMRDFLNKSYSSNFEFSKDYMDQIYSHTNEIMVLIFFMFFIMISYKEYKDTHNCSLFITIK